MYIYIYIYSSCSRNMFIKHDVAFTHLHDAVATRTCQDGASEHPIVTVSCFYCRTQCFSSTPFHKMSSPVSHSEHLFGNFSRLLSFCHCM